MFLLAALQLADHSWHPMNAMPVVFRHLALRTCIFPHVSWMVLTEFPLHLRKEQQWTIKLLCGQREKKGNN